MTSPQRRRVSVDVLEERQELARTLLSRPWVTKGQDPELFARVKDHYGALRDWFANHAGYALLLTRQFVKLEKVPASYQSWMGIGSFYGPRDYALFTYGLWYLEGRADKEQFLLSEMVETIRDHLVGDGWEVDWGNYDHRLSMVRALKKLRELSAITSIEGEEAGWVRDEAGANVLYEASSLARYVLRRFPKELMAYASLEELYEVERTDNPLAESEEQVVSMEARLRRHQVFRRLLLEPVVYDWDWTEAERRYVQTQRAWLIQQMEEAIGLAGRRFREGLYFYWPDLLAEMDLFPSQSASSDLVLLVANAVRTEMAGGTAAYGVDELGAVRMTRGEFERILLALREMYEPYWTKDYREKSTTHLAEDVLQQMEDWNLATVDDATGVVLLPALSRFSGAYPFAADIADGDSEAVARINVSENEPREGGVSPI
ncbi:MAG: TIGR02678 family protein [Alicyclobacillaceae bacterium]|nr:TIGR02678 family protein [Alicyclobacillaceae bacterium]